MAKKIKCYLRLHGIFREFNTATFDSITEAKEWVAVCWNRPYTIVRIK